MIIKIKMKIVQKVLLFLGIILVVWAFLIMTIFGIYLIMSLGKTETKEAEGIDFGKLRLTTFDPAENSVTRALLSLKQTYGENDYLSYQDDSGKYNLVSNFGATEYKCTGKCYCNRGTERKEVGMFLVATVFALMISYSRQKAVKKAEEEFTNEICPAEDSGECLGEIIAEDVECEALAETVEGEVKSEVCETECMVNPEYNKEFLAECYGDDNVEDLCEEDNISMNTLTPEMVMEPVCVDPPPPEAITSPETPDVYERRSNGRKCASLSSVCVVRKHKCYEM